jgi:hypothetical protein
MPSEEILFSLAGRVHVMLRRKINRTVDVEWMCADAAYAKEVIKLARSVESEELHKLADRIEQVHPLLLDIENPVAAMPQSAETKYMATLR